MNLWANCQFSLLIPAPYISWHGNLCSPLPNLVCISVQMERGESPMCAIISLPVCPMWGSKWPCNWLMCYRVELWRMILEYISWAQEYTTVLLYTYESFGCELFRGTVQYIGSMKFWKNDDIPPPQSKLPVTEQSQLSLRHTPVFILLIQGNLMTVRNTLGFCTGGLVQTFT